METQFSDFDDPGRRPVFPGEPSEPRVVTTPDGPDDPALRYAPILRRSVRASGPVQTVKLGQYIAGHLKKSGAEN